MARLQDFSDVTPSSSSDKLLIVQSAGQGLATLDTAGQQIANNTSVSQLNTTRKTLAGAINEHDSEIGSLSTLTTTDKSSIVGAVNSQGVASAITPTSTKGTFSACYQSVVGDMVIVQGVFACTTTVTNGVIFTLPYGLKSGTNSSGFLMYDNTAKAYGSVLIANSGDVSTIGTITTGHSYRFTFAYMK